MPHPSLRWLTGIGTYLASPYAFAILALYGIVWAFVGDLDFHGFATLATSMIIYSYSAPSTETPRLSTPNLMSFCTRKLKRAIP